MTGQISIYDLLNRFDAFGGVERVSQAGFCLWYALIRKSNKLGWAGTFSMTNAELIYTGGFSSEKALWQVRNKLVQMGLIEYEAPPRGKTMAGKYKINFDFDRAEDAAVENETSRHENMLPKNIEVIPNCFPRENTLESVWESLRNQFGNRSGNINNNNRLDKINDNDDIARKFSEILTCEFGRPLLPGEIKQANRLFKSAISLSQENALEILQEAIKRCTSRGIDKVAYISRIVANWEKNGLTSLNDIFAFEKMHKPKGGKSSGKNGGSTRIDDNEQYDTMAWEAAGFAVTSGN